MAKKDEPELTRYEQLKDRVEALNERLKDVQEKTQDYITEHPMKATLMAFGIGVVAGALVTKLMKK